MKHIRSINDLFAPKTLFPFAFVIYFGIGSLNLIDWGYVPHSQWIYYVLALISFYLGIFITNITWGKKYPYLQYYKCIPIVRWKSSFITVITLLILISTIAMVISWRKTGIPAFSDEIDIARVNASENGYLLLIFLSIKAYFITLFIYLRTNIKATKKTKFVVSIYLVFILLCLLGSGNRGHIVHVMITSLFVYIYTIPPAVLKIKLLKIITVFTALLISFTLIGYFRYLRMFNGGFLVDIVSKYNYPPYLLIFAPLYLYMRNGPKMFSDVIYSMRHHDFTFGQLHIAPLIAPLPGHQESADMIIKKILDMQFEGFGVAATLLSSFYIDFGILGIIIGMLLIGVVIQHLYYNMLSKESPRAIGLYAFFMMNLLMSLYGNIISSFNVFWTPILMYVIISKFANIKVKGRESHC